MFSCVVYFSLAVLAACAESEVPETRLELTAVPNVGQYFLYGEAKTWNEGMNYCASEGGHLAVANTVEQADALKSLLTTFRVTSVHIGLHDQFVANQYVSVDGGEISSANWAPGFPTNNAANQCGGFNKDGAMDIDCATSQRTICQLRSLSSFSPISPHGLYDFHLEGRSWQAAWEICRGEGGHLWVVDTPTEAQAVGDAFPQVSDVWVGVHRLGGDDAFVNVLGKPLNATGFARWETGYPFGTSVTRPYVALKNVGGAQTLWTSTASLSLPFICERATA